MELLTSAEAAEYLRLKERKLYELVATGAVPCTKVTGRWLFPKAELDRWIAASLTQPSGFMPAEPPPIIGGSHDPLLEWALRESGSALATLPEGSERGLERFLAGEVVAAAVHLHALDHGETDANVEAVRRSAKTHDAVLIAFVRREQGFVVAPGNPLGLSAIADAVERRARLALRPKGAGAQLLLLALLHRAGAPFEAIAHGPVCQTGPDIAQAIRAGHADCGDCDPVGRERGRPRVRADHVGKFRPRAAPARLFPRAHAGLLPFSKVERVQGARAGGGRLRRVARRTGAVRAINGCARPRRFAPR